MKIQMQVGLVKQAIKNAANIATSNKEGVMCFVKFDALTKTVSASNQTASLVQKIDMACSVEEGAMLVEAGKLSSIFNSFEPDLMATLELKDSKIEMKCGRSKFKLSTLPVEQFAVGVLKGEKSSITMNKGELSTILDKISNYVANNDVRVALNGILIAIKDEVKEVDFVGTNGHFISVIKTDKVNFETETYDKKQFIISPLFARMISSLTGGDGIVTIDFYENFVLFHDGVNSLWGRVIDAKFPDYNGLATMIGNEHNGAFTEIPANILKGSLSRIAPLIDKVNRILIKPQGDKTIIQTQNTENDIGYDEVDIKLPFDAEISLNNQYLATILKTNDHEAINVVRNEANNVLHFKTLNDFGISYQILMPLRT